MSSNEENWGQNTKGKEDEELRGIHDRLNYTPIKESIPEVSIALIFNKMQQLLAQKGAFGRCIKGA